MWQVWLQNGACNQPIGGALMRTMILDALALATFIAAMVLLLALGSMR